MRHGWQQKLWAMCGNRAGMLWAFQFDSCMMEISAPFSGYGITDKFQQIEDSSAGL